MFNINAVLLICSVDFADGTKYILSTDTDKLVLPESNIESNLEDEVNLIFEKRTNFNAAWANIRLMKAQIVDNKLNMYYLTKIPFESIINGVWVKCLTASIINPQIQDCLTHV